ncbi:MAG: phosphate ABC transporter permease [candidate division NC10 bacterium RIFCSPLOWO2_02_FULL_66_22]|nr:MAG: phosphate ABC transporter permease [candidate division NC10 bacterium RIFCSPLOWO2_02_FULL_66_22]
MRRAGVGLMANAVAELPRTTIRPSTGWIRLNFRELWDYRELLYFLIWRDIKVRYKQTVLGAAWAIIQPFSSMVVFSIFFGRLAKIPSDGLPYPIFSYCALLPWNLFANALAGVGQSVVGSQNLITKVYFPRLMIPLSRVLAGLVDFGIAFIMLLGLMVYYRIWPSPLAFLTVPLFLVFALAAALAVGLWLSVLNVMYRDVRYTIPFLVQFWLFATPVVYPASLVPEPWHTFYGLNPMAGVVEGFRWSLLGSTTAPGPILVVSISVVLVLLVGGLFYFRRMEKIFADMV